MVGSPAPSSCWRRPGRAPSGPGSSSITPRWSRQRRNWRRWRLAMAMALGGEADDLMAISEVFCFLLSACELSGDLVRCEEWCQLALDFAERNRCPFLSAY